MRQHCWPQGVCLAKETAQLTSLAKSVMWRQTSSWIRLVADTRRLVGTCGQGRNFLSPFSRPYCRDIFPSEVRANRVFHVVPEEPERGKVSGLRDARRAEGRT